MYEKLVVVGRHKAKYDIEAKFDEVEQVNPTFKNEGDVIRLLNSYERKTDDAPFVSMLFQATSPQVALALIIMDNIPVRVGLVFAKPGERPPARTRKFESVDGSGMFHANIAGAVEFANPRAEVSESDGVVTISVESPMRFKFERIEWVN